MRICPFCQAIIRDEARFCYNCGSDLLDVTGSVDTDPTQPIKLNNPNGQPVQQYGQPYSQPPNDELPPDTNQPSYWQPDYSPPAPTDNHLPTWLPLIAGLSLLVIFACGVAMFIMLITSKNGVTGLVPQVSTQIAQAFGGAGSDTPTPIDTTPIYTPTPWPTFTPSPTNPPQPTDPPQPTATPQAEASLTPNPTQDSITNKLLSPECRSSLDQLSKISDEIKNDPLKVLEETWRKDVDQATTDLKTNCGSLDSASPIPGEVGQVQKLMNLATSEFDQAKLLWNQAIEERDPGKAISAAQHVGEAANYLSQAMVQLQKLVP